MSLQSLHTTSRFNNQMYMNDQQRCLFVKHNEFFKNKFYANYLCNTPQEKINDYLTDYSFFKKSFVYIITETVAEYPYPYFSEKTWKAFIYKMPFMIVGSKNSLTQLRSFGFKTFNDFWDESYDTLDFASDRIDMVVKNLKILSELSHNEIDIIYKKMLPIIEYNQNHLKTFYQNQLNDINKELENL